MKIGAQLYNVRAYTQTLPDLVRSLRRIREAGFTCVQLSGAGPIPARDVKAACDGEGLCVVLTHTDPARILYDTENVIREHAELGCRYVGIGGMPARYRSCEWIDCFAEDFLPAARKLRDSGMLLMYHNHNFEFERMRDGRRIFDVLIDSMPGDLMGVTLDTYWLQAAGCDPADWIERLADRIPCVHLKDMTVHGFDQRFAPVGEGNMDFPRILRALEKAGKTEFALIEQDDCYGDDPFKCLARSARYLASIGCEL